MNDAQSQQFTAAVSGSGNTAVTWSMFPVIGTLSSSGLYSAPLSVPSQQTVTVKATPVADPTKSASAVVTLNPPPAIALSISPMVVRLSADQSQQFMASMNGAPTTAVIWSLSPALGTISPSGLYTAPSKLRGTKTVMIIATPTANLPTSASATPATATITLVRRF
jgi:hypothetical protein